MNIVDLSMPLAPGMRVFPGHAHTVIYPTTEHEQRRAFGSPLSFRVEALHMSTHEGTHVDAPWHADPNGVPLEEVPLERFLGPAVCLDVSEVSAGGYVTRRQLEAAITRSGTDILARDHVLLHTGHHERAYGTKDWFRHAGLDEEASRWLVGAGVRTVGIDAPSIDSSREMKRGEYPAHRILLVDAQVLIVENLVNLAVVSGRRFHYQGAPLRLIGVGGAPIRAFALLNEMSRGGRDRKCEVLRG